MNHILGSCHHFGSCVLIAARSFYQMRPAADTPLIISKHDFTRGARGNGRPSATPCPSTRRIIRLFPSVVPQSINAYVSINEGAVIAAAPAFLGAYRCESTPEGAEMDPRKIKQITQPFIEKDIAGRYYGLEIKTLS